MLSLAGSKKTVYIFPLGGRIDLERMSELLCLSDNGISCVRARWAEHAEQHRRIPKENSH